MKIHRLLGSPLETAAVITWRKVRCLLMKKDWKYHRGDVYLADLGESVGSEQGGIRPVVVIQNEAGCRSSTTMTVVPLTSNLKKIALPIHYVLRFATFLRETSMAMGEQVRVIDKVRVLTYLGKLDQRDLRAIERTAIYNIRADRKKKRRKK